MGKKVYVELNSGRRYSGVVKSIDDRGLLVFIDIIDKFGKRVSFLHSEIKVIQEEA